MGISIAMVGLSAFSSSFVELYRDHPLVSRIALCDLDPQKLAAASAKFGISECYDSLEAVLASDIEAVVIITQHWMHAKQAMQALKAGKHVYSAVPAVYGLESDAILELLDELIDTVKQTGQVYMMGETSRYRAETIYALQQAKQGAFGEITYAECEYWHDLDSPESNLRNVFRRRWGANWDDGKRGDIPMFYPTHALCGPVTVLNTHMASVSARGYVYPNDDWFLADGYWGNVFSNELAMYQAASGALVRHCEFRRIGHTNLESFSIYGTEASLVNDAAGSHWVNRSQVEAVDFSGIREDLPAPLAKDLGGHGGSHAYLVHEFVSACAEQRQPSVNVWQAARYIAPGVVAHKSALRDGEWLTVPDWGDAPDSL